jgi:hypothetical protein
MLTMMLALASFMVMVSGTNGFSLVQKQASFVRALPIGGFDSDMSGVEYVDWNVCDSESILGDDELRFMNITESPYGMIDLRITIDTGYHGTVRLRGGKNVCFGAIDMRPDTKIKYLFEWVKHGTNTTVEFQHFYMVFFDLDHPDDDSTEVLTFHDRANAFYLDNGSELIPEGSLNKTGNVTFRSIEIGHAPNNPSHPDLLTGEQMKRAIAIDYVNKSALYVTFEVIGSKKNRRFFFAGRSNLIPGFTPMPTPSPTPRPTRKPTPMPTPEPTECTAASCQAYADPHVSGFDNQNNAGPASLSLSQIHRFVGNRPGDLNLNQTGDFWFVKNDLVHIQGRFAFSHEFAPDGAAIGAVAVGGPFLGGSVLLVEPLSGGVEWNGARVFCDTSDALDGLGKIQCLEGQGKLPKMMSDLEIDFPIPLTSCSNAALKMKINRFEHHVDVKMTVPPLPGGISGECGNFNGVPEDDMDDSAVNHVGVLQHENLFPSP